MGLPVDRGAVRAGLPKRTRHRFQGLALREAIYQACVPENGAQRIRAAPLLVAARIRYVENRMCERGKYNTVTRTSLTIRILAIVLHTVTSIPRLPSDQVQGVDSDAKGYWRG